MQKIISLFQRNYDGDRLVRDEVVPGAEWVLAGEGIATRKMDGTCCLVRGGKLFKRYEVKKGGKAPPDFEPASEVDSNTGKQQGWVPVKNIPDDRWHHEAFGGDWQACCDVGGWLLDGTYELCGPKVQGNPEGETRHVLFAHGAIRLDDVPRDFDGIREYLRSHDIEGIVWHHDDGRMVKVKGKDFGIKRGAL